MKSTLTTDQDLNVRDDTRDSHINWGNWFIWLLCFIVSMPLLALVIIAMQPDAGIWSHLISTILPRAVITTVSLMIGVGFVTLFLGAGTAWLVTLYNFPGAKYFKWLLLLPLAMPTYISAFSYVELWDYSGWIQSGLRDLFGWKSARDYWFPDVRSMGGAIFVLSIVLYPYVYLTARASFIQQSSCALEVGRTLGRTGFGMWWSLGLPMARPALVAGVTLVCMECLNDIGAVEHFGVNTLTVSIYTTWLERSSLSGAAEIAVLMLLIVFALLWFERWQRNKRGFHNTTGKFSTIYKMQLTGLKAFAAFSICLY